MSEPRPERQTSIENQTSTENQTSAEEQPVLVERRGRVGLITLNRPKALNALNKATMDALVAAAIELDSDSDVGAVVITGSTKAFAAGADIKQMATQSYPQMYQADWFRHWEDLTRLRIPLVAAVSGYALGGGCELAMMCDVIIAGQGATFGQPEINLGVIPGMGGSQRLTRAVGKAKAMDMVLTGRNMGAEEAERSGLVSRVVPDDAVLETAFEVATTIASKSKPVAMLAKEAVNASFEMGVVAGVAYERRLFHSLFALHDQKEGMEAFVSKRKPEFKNQ